jgi:glycosyltransferase involved in cell wall biosynthesis
MQIVQATFAVFHQFELANQLYRRGHLRKIYSTWPWARVKREGIPHALVGTFPYVQTPDYFLTGTAFFANSPFAPMMKRLNAESFDTYTRMVIPECDALVALAGAGLRTGAKVQQRGGKYICDSGSSHHRYQDRILQEEHKRWNFPYRPEAESVIVHDERIYDRADAITVASSFSARSFVEMGFPRENIHTIPYGVRLDSFVRSTPPPDIRERFEVIFAGQVSLRKGIPYLLEAFANVRHPHKRLRIMGAVNPAFKSVLARLPQQSVEFLGIMGESHVLLLPSVEDGFGLVMGQAMNCGCPVIASTNTGGEDLFTDGEEGFIVPIRDAAALTDRMQRLIEQPDLQYRMSAAAIERIATLGGWDEYGDRWESLLHTLTGK